MAATLVSLFSMLALACGSRGDPLPPLRPIPPPIPEIRVDQRGIDAIVSFPLPPPMFVFTNTPVPIEAIELLVATDRYPAITPEMLAVALDEERRSRLREAREAAARTRQERQQRRLDEQLRIATEQALAAGEEPPTLESLGLVPEEPEEEDAEQETEEPLTEDELLLRRVPRNILRDWRDSDVRPDMMIDAARRLDGAVDLLWDELGLPAAIVDLREPPALPDPVELVTAADRVSRRIAYEGSMDPITFLERASVVARFEYEDLQEEAIANRVYFTHRVGIPSPGPIRTRYFFAVRAAADSKYDGAVSTTTSLAPAAVPVAPPSVVATVLPAGVTITWPAAGGDVWGELRAPEEIRYNIYRRRRLDEGFPVQPINLVPLPGTTYSDTTMTWGEDYVYQVRGIDAPIIAPGIAPGTVPPPPPTVPTLPAGPRKEGAGRDSNEVLVIDTFPPAQVSGLSATRAARRITLRWRAPDISTVAGYRVYRHVAPAPAIPSLLPKPETKTTGEEAAPTTDVPSAAGTPPTTAATGTAPAATTAASLCPPIPQPPAQEPGTGRRRQLNSLVDAGWELITATLVTAQRYIDPAAASESAWVYLVSAVDAAGNEGLMSCVGVLPEGTQ